MNTIFRNTKTQGNMGMGAAIAYFTGLDMCVSVPLTDSEGYDLVIDERGILKKVQVKTTSQFSDYGNSRVSLSTCGGSRKDYKSKNLDKSAIDYLFIATMDNRWYLIPAEFIGGSGTGISLGKKYDEYCVNAIIKREVILYERRQGAKRGITRERKAKPTKIDWPAAEEVLNMVNESSYLGTGKALGVSDNAVRKFLAKNNLTVDTKKDL